MNIYPVLAGIRQEFPRDARWRCIWEKRSPPGGIFYESFVTFPWPPATHLSPTPPFQGDYFLLICITPQPTKGARDRPRHCNVNKLRLPDLLPRGGHASSFVIAAPLFLRLMPETPGDASTGQQSFFIPLPPSLMLAFATLPSHW